MIAFLLPDAHAAEASWSALELWEDTEATLDVTGACPGACTYEILEDAALGEAWFEGATLHYRPTDNAYGFDGLVFVTVDDAGVASEPLTIDVTVYPVNDVPIVQPLSVLGVAGRETTFYLPAADAEGDPLVWTLADEPLHGTLAVDPATGLATFRAAPAWTGVLQVRFRVSDGLSSAGATLTLRVLPAARPPR